jgi:hypothetical protein
MTKDVLLLQMECNMPLSEVFALSHSPVNRFLFAEVGLEPSGVPLTVLSLLARLGEDPWRQAQDWSTLPEKTVIDQLAERIRQMPIALQDARLTAKRLVMLLPAQRASVAEDDPDARRRPHRRDGIGVAILIVGMSIGIAVNVMLVASHNASVDAAPGQGAVAQPLTGMAYRP